MNIFETLKELSDNKRNKEEKMHKKISIPEREKQKPASYIYLEDNQVKERKLSELLDSSASVYINRTMIYESAKLIHDSIFGK